MREGFVNINCIPTHIFTWGNWIEDSIEKNEVVICITGNPGLAGFYTQFMSTISQKIGADVPVWVIGLCLRTIYSTGICYELIFIQILSNVHM